MYFVLRKIIAFGVPPLEENVWNGSSWVGFGEKYDGSPQKFPTREEAKALADTLEPNLEPVANATVSIQVVEQH